MYARSWTPPICKLQLISRQARTFNGKCITNDCAKPIILILRCQNIKLFKITRSLTQYCSPIFWPNCRCRQILIQFQILIQPLHYFHFFQNEGISTEHPSSVQSFHHLLEILLTDYIRDLATITLQSILILRQLVMVSSLLRAAFLITPVSQMLRRNISFVKPKMLSWTSLLFVTYSRTMRWDIVLY